MIYVFYEKLPLYEISSHNHKFVKMHDPPLPTSVITSREINCLYQKGGCNRVSYNGRREVTDDPPLPTSVIHYAGDNNSTYGDVNRSDFKGHNSAPCYDPPLPSSILQFKSERGKHKTQKPTTMIDWILKYYSKEGDTILDPTMGSGSTGVSCKSLNREFIGIEMHEEIKSCLRAVKVNITISKEP